MLNQTLNDIGFEFSVKYDGKEIPFNKWATTDDCIFYMPLSTLVDNGHAILDNDKCIVPYENIYLLDSDDRIILGVPEKYNKSIRLRGDGTLNATDFSYKLEFLTHVPDGDLIRSQRNGNVIFCGRDKYLLSEKQYELAEKIDAYNSKSAEEKTPDFNLRYFAEVKALAKSCSCQLDSYLENENVYVPGKIKIEVGQDEEGFTIDPAIDIEENDKFKKVFERSRRVMGAYPIEKSDGSRVRVVLNKEQKTNLEFLKASGGRHKTHEEIRDIAQRPTEYFDPDVFDISELYSERVIEIGIYKPKFYPFICPYKSCWIVGAAVETPSNGTSKITVENESDLSELNEAIKKADELKKDTINYKDTDIAIDDAKALSKAAKKQLKKPEKPIEDSEIAGHKVLIIKGNEENDEFSTATSEINKCDKFKLYKNPYLSSAFCLKKHQEEGVAWLQYLYTSHASGCLMADDMGLGKTLQILYFMDWHSRNFQDHKPYLIVAPISLLENWENEYNKFFMSPRLNIIRLTSKDVPRKFCKEIVDDMQKMDVILTNYESLRISQLNFCAVDFDVVALDEAQKIKSPNTLVTNAAKALKCKFRIAMTGTPVENTLLDIWCIMDFCVPGLLGNAKSFAAQYQSPLKDKDTDIVVLGNEVHEKLGIYFMRRLKKDVAKELPVKHEKKEQISMPDIQELTYSEVVDSYLKKETLNMLVTINQMKEVSEHPYLYDKTLYNHDAEELVDTSARLQATISFLDKIKNNGEKAIIFAERKDTQKMLQRICRERYGLITKIINGDTPTIVNRYGGDKQSRQASIDEYQSTKGFNVIIMSPIAAGMGLNVTAANHVIHYSRHWNPAKESQATDRAYRIGQTKDVYVYYPMAVSNNFKSFDETLDELLSRKTTLATSTIFPTERIEVNQEELGQMLFGV